MSQDWMALQETEVKSLSEVKRGVLQHRRIMLQPVSLEEQGGN